MVGVAVGWQMYDITRSALALGFVLGVAVASGIVAVEDARRRRLTRSVLGFATTALVDCLGHLRDLTPAGSLGDQAQRCCELAAAVSKLVSQ